MAHKYVYMFEEGNGSMKELLGGKGAGLAEMTNIGLPVPPGFTITTEACTIYYENNGKLPQEIIDEAMEYLAKLETKAGRKLGDPEHPLLVSVRSGARISMPGMMDTILNLGLNDQTVEGLAKESNNPRFAYDCYRRFIQMFSDVVMHVNINLFEGELEKLKEEVGARLDTDLTAKNLQELIKRYKDIVRKNAGREFPQDVKEQLLMAINAVFESWNTPRAITYRKLNKIPDDWGTAVNVVMMAFGNMGNNSGTGVAFTRNPSTGEKVFYGEFLINAQGEDVVAGIRTPKPIAELKDEMPVVYDQLLNVAKTLENHYKDMQDIEFTVQEGKLYMLQTRSGKRTPQAAIKIAVDLCEEGIIDKETALMRVEPEQISMVMHRQIDPNSKYQVIAKGLAASPGAGMGEVVFDADEAEKLAHEEGRKVILVRPETTPDDIHGLAAAEAVLTSRGGMTSHAAVVARGMGKPAICGCESIKIDLDRELFTVGDITVKKGDIITVDGTTGNVILGEVNFVDPTFSEEFTKLLTWADEVAKIGVRANADTPVDATTARNFGAKGVGLCRTEHMFMATDRLPVVQEMILAQNYEDRKAALDRLLPMQQGDFEAILKTMEGYEVIIRLLDPPLHEFLPDEMELALKLNTLRLTNGSKEEIDETEELLKNVRALKEFNPMLGFRGCRLGMIYPEIYEMQIRAILNATVNLLKQGVNVIPEIMFPLVGTQEEMKRLKEMAVNIGKEIMDAIGVKLDYKIGTMIEVPRAALVADQLAEYADFFSFGTNDLTQTTFGYSRDDAEHRFLFQYIEKKILKDDPFETLDADGVGQLIKIAHDKGRSVKSDLSLGICGEHGGDPRSIDFCYTAGLNYVSCSPYRVPVARLAAAQATIRHK
ncbi:MAG: pyruvate, phosphate dikinase [Thermoanaerobacteraceae bacterium]|nr:pyruvate, phosphate dikinase [Thermoanaerobacteraceae bacterium]